MSKDSSKLSYAEAIGEVEQILERLDSDELDVDQLAEKVKRATELIALCQSKLRKAEKDVAKVLKQDEEEK